MNAVTHAMDEILAEGTVVGRHRIVGKLAEGAHAILYMGEHQVTRAEVAIKVLRFALRRDAEMLARFDREARVMGRLAGAESIVHVHDAGALDDGRRFLVMEFVRGRELSTLLKNSGRRHVPMGFDRILAIARDLASALRDAHGKGVIHRDLKPSNVMIGRTPDGREYAKLVDFGVSGDLEVSGTSADLTVVGSVIGTPEYMSPEQHAGQPATVSMDIFALGVVLFEMTTGSLPPPQVLRQGAAPRVATLRPEVPPALDVLIDGCLRPDARARVGDAIEVLSRLRTASEELEGKPEANAWAEGRLVRTAGAIEVAADSEPPLSHPVSHPLSHPLSHPVSHPLSHPVSHPLSHPLEEPPRASVGAEPADPSSRRTVVIVLVVLLFAGLATAITAWALSSNAGGIAADRAPVPDAAPTPAPEPAPAASPTPEPTPTPTPTPTPEPTPAPTPSPTDTGPADAAPEPLPAGPTLLPIDPDTANHDGPTPAKPVASKTSPATPTPAKPAPEKPAPASAECVEHRDAAAEASEAMQWRGVLEHTRSAACWTDRTARLRLRVEALAELSRYGDCAKEGEGSSDPTVLRTVGLCRARLEGG
jgi:serine/threonine protein kinase